jgi:LmbE family N-acetylglucosaminyl deacetylase
MIKKNILLLSPHTDDIELGCGGTVCKLIEEGHNIYWIVFSTAEASLKDLPKETLKNEFLSVIDELKLSSNSYKTYPYEVRKLDLVRQEILDELIRVRDVFKPDIVFSPSLNDFHQDHQVVVSESVRAFKTTSAIISYELPWNYINFSTQLFSKLTKKHIDMKWKLLQHYKSQIIDKPYFKKDVVYGSARVRGVQCNTKYAEAFEVIRWII